MTGPLVSVVLSRLTSPVWSGSVRGRQTRNMVIQRLTPSDVVEYRRIRLRGLRESPTAFGSSYEEEVKRPIKMFVARLEQADGKWTFGALENNRIVGVITLIREDGKKERHKASIFGMYVEPKMRRKGIARELLARAIETAQRVRGLKQLRLSVVETSRPALRLYKSEDFKVYGREEDALFVSGALYTELFLVRKLRRASDRSLQPTRASVHRA
jgi:RimJ/RimL family protein N-acetyltransferase